MTEHYDSSDEAAYRLVDVDELDALLRAGSRPVSRDSGRISHLLRRVRATLESDRVTIAGLQKHIAQMTDRLQQVGQATTLNPMDALRYLDDDQRELLFDRIARDRLSMLRHMVSQAEQTRERLLAELEQIRDAAEATAQRADLPADVRADFARLLAYLPSEIAPVHRPPLLEFPDPEPLHSPPPAQSPPAQLPRRQTLAEAAGRAPSAIADPGTDLGSVTGAPEPAPTETGSHSGAPTYVDPWAAPADPDPAYVDPWAASPDPAGTSPAYVDPWAAPADPAAAYVDPWASEGGEVSAPAGDDTDLHNLFD